MNQSNAIQSEELPSSQLGTKDYWDNFYTKELENFHDSQDEGEIWFGYNRMMKVVKWMLNEDSIKTHSNILDIGCGNGVFLLELAEEEYVNLFGLDYSITGIELAQKIATEKGKEISYMQADFLGQVTVKHYQEKGLKFHVCHDKGTYDAISLRPDDSKSARQKYIDTLTGLLCDDGLFVITSCNWTLAELKVHFSNDFRFSLHIPAPTFQYGGKTGSTVSTAVFMKK